MEFRALRYEDKAAFDRACLSFQETNPDWDFAFEYSRENDFKEYLKYLDDNFHGRNLAPDRVASSYLVGVVDGEIIGRVSIRHELNEHLRRCGGHIGYGVVKAWRGRGVATELLRQTLDYVRTLGLQRVMLSCHDSNVGSYRIIEKFGGVMYEKVPYEGTIARNYWIDLK